MLVRNGGKALSNFLIWYLIVLYSVSQSRGAKTYCPWPDLVYGIAFSGLPNYYHDWVEWSAAESRAFGPWWSWWVRSDTAPVTLQPFGPCSLSLAASPAMYPVLESKLEQLPWLLQHRAHSMSWSLHHMLEVRLEMLLLPHALRWSLSYCHCHLFIVPWADPQGALYVI